MSSLTILHPAVETDCSYSFLLLVNALWSALEFNYLEAKAEVCLARVGHYCQARVGYAS